MYKEGFTINSKQIKLPSLRLFSQRMFFSKALFLLPLLCAVTYYGYLSKSFKATANIRNCLCATS